MELGLSLFGSLLILANEYFPKSAIIGLSKGETEYNVFISFLIAWFSLQFHFGSGSVGLYISMVGQEHIQFMYIIK